MTLWAKYIKETRNINSIETKNGFATYIIDGEECYVEDVFVSQDQRRNNVATNMIDQIIQIAKDKGCKIITTSVNARFKDPTTSLKACLGYGFSVFRVMNDAIFLKMEI